MDQVIIFLFPFIVIAGAVALIIFQFRKGSRIVDIPPVLPDEGLNIPVLDLIWGRLLSFGRKNGIGRPYFILFKNKMKFKARDNTFSFSLDTLFRMWVEKEIPFSEIQEVSFRRILFSNYMVIVFRQGGPALNVWAKKENLKRMFGFFRDNYITLTQKATDFLSN